MRVHSKLVVKVAAIAFAVLASRSSAEAVQQIFSCDPTQVNNVTTCTSACELATNITCDPFDPNQTGITLTNGADLDMNGLTITCLRGTCGTAVTMTGTNSQVKDTNNSAEAVITGNWTVGVDCNGYSGSLVEKVHITQTAAGAVGIDSCRTVRDNVIESTAGTTFGVGINEPVTAENNFIIGHGNAIWAVSTASTIDHNMIHTNVNSHYGVYAFLNSGLVAVTGNIFFGPGKPFDTTTSASNFEENYCDSTETYCGSCISSGRCVDVPAAPFTFP